MLRKLNLSKITLELGLKENGESKAVIIHNTVCTLSVVFCALSFVKRSDEVIGALSAIVVVTGSTVFNLI